MGQWKQASLESKAEKQVMQSGPLFFAKEELCSGNRFTICKHLFVIHLCRTNHHVIHLKQCYLVNNISLKLGKKQL